MNDGLSLLPPNWQALSLTEVASLAPIHVLKWRIADEACIEVAVKREDLLHPALGGNKFYKLAFHLEKFRQQHNKRLISFGGAYSNHIYALAAVGQALGIETIGVIRGERPALLSPTLMDAQAMGMNLVFVSRQEYLNKTDPSWLRKLKERYPGSYIIPEGGGDLTGAIGCQAWAEASVRLCPWEPHWLCVAAGTGATAAGVLAGGHTPLCVVLALKGRDSELQQMKNKINADACALRHEKTQHLPELLLEANYHCGGYARVTPELRQFMLEFEQETSVPLDPVYTAKVFWAIAQKARAKEWIPGTRLLVLHTGGIQGRRGMNHL